MADASSLVGAEQFGPPLRVRWCKKVLRSLFWKFCLRWKRPELPPASPFHRLPHRQRIFLEYSKEWLHLEYRHKDSKVSSSQLYKVSRLIDSSRAPVSISELQEYTATVGTEDRRRRTGNGRTQVRSPSQTLLTHHTISFHRRHVANSFPMDLVFRLHFLLNPHRLPQGYYGTRAANLAMFTELY